MEKSSPVIWEGYEYIEENEQYLEIIIDEREEFEDELIYLSGILLQTKREMESKEITQYPEIGREHINSRGESYVIRERCIHRLLKKIPLRNSLSSENELIQVPSNNTHILFIPPPRHRR